MFRRALFVAICVTACTAVEGAADQRPAGPPRMEFTPLSAGTYRLQSIQPVAEATLLDESGRPVKLSTLTRGKITLLTFFYTYCVDPLGCPFSHETLSQLRDRILLDRRLADDVRFVGISCDPTNDTPEAIARYAEHFTRGPRFEWRFLTAPAVPALLPVLDDFGQDVSVETDAEGRPTRTLHHMLKVFLIDERGTVREIYTLAFIQPDVMFNDIRTLYLESRTVASREPPR
jgi:cytochrome oxidase Cu insertion factor (SCO1/SenC/PrrC family)